jgi:DNA mismatch endonuclease (patch repair protein)
MLANRGRNTQLEVDLRRALHRVGLRFRKHRRPLPAIRCEADVVFPRLKVAVFVNGCFWHACPDHATWPVVNAAFWTPKIEGNRARDLKNDRLLTDSGWTVVRLWEHQPIEEMVEAVNDATIEARRRLGDEKEGLHK